MVPMSLPCQYLLSQMPCQMLFLKPLSERTRSPKAAELTVPRLRPDQQTHRTHVKDLGMVPEWDANWGMKQLERQKQRSVRCQSWKVYEIQRRTSWLLRLLQAVVMDRTVCRGQPPLTTMMARSAGASNGPLPMIKATSSLSTRWFGVNVILGVLKAQNWRPSLKREEVVTQHCKPELMSCS